MRLERLALVCFVLWSVGAGLTRVIGIWTAVSGTAIGLGLAALFLARGTIIPLLRPTARTLAWGLAAGVVMIAVTYGLYPVVERASAPFSASVLFLYGLLCEVRPSWLPLLLLPFIIVSEELVWRGVVFEALSRQGSGVRGQGSGGLATAVVFSAVAYAAAHAPIGSPLLVALALVCGLFWSALRAWTGSLVAPLVSHLLWDLLVFSLRPLA